MDGIGVDRGDSAGRQDPAGIDPADEAEPRPGALGRVGDGADGAVLLRERLARLLRRLAALGAEGFRRALALGGGD